MQIISNAGKKTTIILLFVSGTLIFSYTTVRAYLLSITWDEAFTYIEFVRNGIIVPEKYGTMSANNHLLNTCLDICFVKWFGVNELALRLSSLFAHILFLFYSAKLVVDFKNKWISLASFLIINLNPYMLDFFSLSRGYGLSLGLMMASIYYVYTFCVNDYKNKYLLFTTIFSVLSVLANFVLLNYFIVLFGVIILLASYKSVKSGDTKTNKIFSFLLSIIFPALIMVLVCCLIIPVILKLKESGALFFGGNKSFWTDTISTIVERSFYELGYSIWLEGAVKLFMLCIVLSASIFIAFKIVKKKFLDTSLFLFSLLLLLVLSSLSSVVQHHFLGMLYLSGRTALFLIVLFNLILVFFINELSETIPKATALTYLAGFVALIHFVLAFNLKYILDWKFEAETKDMLNNLKKIQQIQYPNGITIRTSPWLKESIDFYQITKKMKWLKVQPMEEPLFQVDYFYLLPEDLARINEDSIKIIRQYPLTQNVLLKNKFEIISVKKHPFHQSLNKE